MPYKKRVAIFLSVMCGLFVALSIFYVMSVRSNVENVDPDELKPSGFDEIKNIFNSSLKDKFEFTE